ncbi:B12-binding domain-containing radical SAM protein [Streptacidiphilus rugosus]|uniref:B12-binding domain-containing radical SAM protein n=1 Tax=Streptacidiphilus rugosus TaxID=405783 RepID=UPI00055EE38E|nr:B12-binding domain-containing radical SAM protein [Streptacidiphilus rugosus]
MAPPLQLSVGREKSRPENAEVPYLLINPPLTDPTYPYHSISYLVASCEEFGFTGHRCLDANVEALNHLARPEYVEGLLEQAAGFREWAGEQPQLSRGEEIAYQAALSGVGLEPDFMRRAIDVFQDGRDFYHYPTYHQATMAVHRWLNLLSLRSVPGVYNGFTLRTGGAVNYLSHRDLADQELLDEIVGPFLDYVTGPFREVLAERPWRMVGLSVNYASQLPFALRMAREIRELLPDAVIVFGGTEVCDDVKYARADADIWRMFPHADLIVPGEGESPLVDILCAVRDGASAQRPEGFIGLGGVLHRGADRRGMRLNYEHVGRLPGPKYDVWDWPVYWSPEPVVLYSPTRGCYWNKCTFCDYGLNTDRPTSPSRERPVELVMEDLRQISGFARTLYFSVDAMSPRYLRTLSEQLAEEQLGLRWSAELRLERTFPKRGTAQLLRSAGCVSIAFGYESGSQRILDLIDKGVRIDQVPLILEQLAEAGIGAQMMGFTGFPTETQEEAEETYHFLARHKQWWSLAGVGGFSLTPGSIIAKQPQRFGVEVLELPRSHDIARAVGWRDLTTGVETRGEAETPIPAALKAQIRRGLGGRPFVGGIDSSHSLLYFSEHGRGLLPTGDQGEARVALVRQHLLDVPFTDLDGFTTAADLEGEHSRLAAGPDGVDYPRMAAWLGGDGSSRRGSSVAVVLPGGGSATLASGNDSVDYAKVLRSLGIVLSPGQAVVRVRA